MIRTATLAAALVAAGALAAEAETTLRFANFEPPQSIAQAEIFEPWAKMLADETGGSLKVEFYSGGALGPDPRKQLDLVTKGIADVGWVFAFFTPARFPQAGLVELPMEILDAGKGTVALNAMYDKGLLHQGLDDVVPVAIFTAPAAVYFTKFEPKSLDDLKGLKAAASGPIRNQIMEALGMLPVGGVNIGNMAESLSRGTIDVGQVNFTAAGTFRVNDVANHAVDLAGGSSMLFILMNRKVYDGLSDDERAALDKGRAFLTQRWSDVIGGAEVTAKAAYAADPARTVLDFTDDERNAIKAQLSGITDAWVAGTEGGQEMLDALRSELAAQN